MKSGRNWLPETKEQAVKDYLETGDASAVAKKYGTTRKTIYNWKSAQKKLGPASEVAEMRDLKKKIRSIEEENQILREVLKKTFQVVKID